MAEQQQQSLPTLKQNLIEYVKLQLGGDIIDLELEKWSERYQIAYHIKRRKNTLTLCFDDDKHYLFFGLTFEPKPTYTSGKPMTDFECKWRLLTDHEVQHRQNS